jgi:UDP-glucose 4-epimerase
MSKTYCLTGISGYIGKLLAQKLTRDPNNKVIGIDLNMPDGLENVQFYQNDIRNPDIVEIFKNENVDVAVHLAFYTHPEGDAKLAESVNVDGTQNILEAAGNAAVKRFVLSSSSAAYGSHPDNAIPMVESQLLRPNNYFYYSAHKAAQEKLAHTFKSEHPDIQLIILRPCVVVGPRINNPTGDSLKHKILIYFKDKKPPLQLIYEDDAVNAFYLASTRETEGVFNIAADGTITFPEVAELMRKKMILLPFGLLCALANIGKQLRLSAVGSKTLKFISNPVVIDPTRFNKCFNFKPKFDTRGALVQFSKSI